MTVEDIETVAWGAGEKGEVMGFCQLLLAAIRFSGSFCDREFRQGMSQQQLSQHAKRVWTDSVENLLVLRPHQG